MLPLVYPGETSSYFPYGPSFEGVHLIKDVVLSAGTLTVGAWPTIPQTDSTRARLSLRDPGLIMTAHLRAERCERVARSVKYDIEGQRLDAIDADQTRVHLGTNSGSPIEKSSHAIAEALEFGGFLEVEGSYVVTEE